jgi:hypothetical protein
MESKLENYRSKVMESLILKDEREKEEMLKREKRA